MYFNSALLASLTILAASAPTAFGAPQPASTAISEGDKFGAITIRSGSEIQNSAIQAAQRSLFVNAKSQNATCASETNSATFYIQDQELRLYSSNDPLNQTIFVDRSGMGMGKIGYITGNESLGRYWETKGWALTESNELQFHGTGIQACPGSIDGGWSIWLQGVEKPGYNENCTGVVAAAYKTDDPIECVYTH